MSFENHFFHSTCLGTNLNYIMSYLFFIISTVFIIIVLTKTNIVPSNMDNSSTIKLILFILWTFVSCLFSRCICYDKSKYTESNNLPYERPKFSYVSV